MHLSKKNAKLNAVSDPLNVSQQHLRARTFDAKPGLAILGGVFLFFPPPHPARHKRSIRLRNRLRLPLDHNGTSPRPPIINVDASEPMFTTMCALLASGFEADISAENWRPLRAQLRDRMQHQQGPAVEAIRDYYKQHDSADPGAALSRYLWFGLVAGPAPDFKPTMRREDLPPEVLALEGFSELLSKYYQEQNIHQLWRQMQPAYNAKSSACTKPFHKLCLWPPDICAQWTGRPTNVRLP